MKADAFDPQAVVSAVRSALPGRAKAGLHAPPKLTRDDQDRLACLLGEAPVGCRWVDAFEEAIVARVGRKHAIAVSSGTAALHLAFLAYHGPKVSMPALTFAGAAAAATYCGCDVSFYDTDPLVGRIAVTVDLLGLPNETLTDIQCPVIEDAAQALGTVDCGLHGDVSILSFNSNKIVTTGGGGMVLTDDDRVAKRVRFLATTAKAPSPHHYVHTEVGFNYRMPNACAALGLVMLDKLDETLAKKARLHEAYRQAFAGLPGVTVVEAPAGTTWNHWLNAIEVPAGQRDATLQALSAAGYECRALYTPLPWLEPYKRFAVGQTFPEAERRFATTVCLPSGPDLAA